MEERMRMRRVFASSFLSLIAVPLFAATTGTVMNIDGQPIAGAKVTLFSAETADARRARLISKAPERQPLSSTTSDARGNFSIDSPKEPVFDLRIEAAGYAPDGQRAVPDDELGTIVLTQAAAKTGTVTAAGKPVAGAIVIFGGGTEFMTKTDANGKYSAPDPGKWANRLVILHPDFAVLEDPIGPMAPKKGIDRTLEPGVAISGKVVAENGTTPVANAAVLIDNWQVATTGEDGAFTVAHAPKDWAMAEARIDNRIATRAHMTGTVSLKLAKGATITGVMTDAKTNTPVAGMEVRLLPAMMFGGPATITHSTFTNAKGAFTLSGVTPGSYQVNPTRPGYLTPNVAVSVTAGQTANKSLVTNARGRVIGTVLDEDKRPVAAARVGARAAAREAMMMIGPNMRNFGLEAMTFSGPDGRFVLRGAPTESDIQVDANKKGYPTAHSSSLRLAPGERKAGVLITIPRGVALTGKVTDRDGRSLSGVAVDALESQNDSGFPGGRRMVVNMMQQDRGDDFVRTGSDGTFTIRVKEGTYDVVFKREGFASKTIRAQQINSSAKPLEVTMDPGVEITGRVTRNGAGVEGVNVGVFSADVTANTITGPDGTFRLEDLNPGPLMLFAGKREEFIQVNRPVSAPAQDVLIEVPPGGRITGRVLDKSSHKPVTQFQAGISTSRSGGGMVIMTPPMLKAFTSDDGSFTLENVPPGPAQVVVNAPGYTTARVGGVNVEEGKAVTDVEVTLDAGVKLTGKVTGPDGAPLAGVSVRPDQSPGANRVMRFDGVDNGTITDASGEYTLEALEAGEKTFTFTRQGYLTESRNVTLGTSASRLDVQLTTGIRVTGTVVAESGGPVTDAIVTASSAGGGGRQARTDAGGNFQIEGVAPGHYTLRATRSGYADGILRDFDTSSGAPARITMKSGGTIVGRVIGLSVQELQDTTVNVGSPNGNASASVDSTGAFKIEGAPTGTVRVSARTGQMFATAGKTSPQKSVQVEPGSTVNVDLEFKSDVVIRGRVTKDGQPMANAAIGFMPRGAQASTNASAQTDSSGNYEVSGLDDATYTVQIFDIQRTAPFTTQYTVKGPGTFDIDIRSSTLRGRVLDATTGAPLADARVEVRATGGDMTSMLSSRAAVTSSDGTFLIDNVARGNYEAKADREGYGHAMRSIVVGDTPEELEFKLSPTSGVSITVVDARDNRTIAANVARVTDAQGKEIDTSPIFRFTNTPEPVKLTLAPGSYRVTLTAFGYAPQTVNIMAPSSPTVRMSPGGTLVIRSKASTITRARLVDSAGNAYVRGPFGGANGIFTVDPSPGITTLQNIAAGSYRLQILGAGDVPTKSVAVTVIDGQQATVDVD
jgi:protocatechuate 3,4-dioxygenase beta subunit